MRVVGNDITKKRVFTQKGREEGNGSARSSLAQWMLWPTMYLFNTSSIKEAQP